MARVPYQPFAEATPTGPSGNLLHTDASPAAFGGQVAEARRQASSDILRGAAELERAAYVKQEFTNELYASDASTKGMQALANAWGPYAKLEGRAAHDALPAFQKDVERIYQETLDNAPNDAAKVMLAKSMRYSANLYTRYGQNHADREFRSWQDRSSKDRAQELGNQAFIAVDRPDDMRQFLDASDVEIRKLYENRGWDEDAIQAEMKRNRGRNLSNIVGAIAVDDPVKAARIFRDYADTIDANSQRTITNTLKPYLQQTAAREIGDIAMGRAPASRRSLGAGLDNEADQAASAAGIPSDILKTVVRLESGGDPRAQRGSYKGLGQMSDDLFQRYGGGDIFSPKDNLRATARKLADEISDFRDKYGLEPTPTDIYLTHQQGAGGYAAHLANPDGPAWANMASTAEGRRKGEAWAKAAIWGNIPDSDKARFGSVENVTSADFINVWRNKVEGVAGGPLPDRATAVNRVKDATAGNPVIQEMAVNHVNRQYQQLEAEQRVEAFKMGEQVKSDVASMLATGQGDTQISPDRVATLLGPLAAEKWRQARSDAYTTWQATNDLYSLSEGQIEQRLESLQPKGGEPDYARKQAIYDGVKEKVDALRRQRNDDPAASVAEDPAVKAASIGDKPDPKVIGQARMDAQAKAGIPEDAQSPITKQEAQRLTVPLRRMLPGEERETLSQMGEDFKKLYGDNWEQAFSYALRVNKVDKETAQMAARVLTKLGQSDVPPRPDAAQVDQKAEVGAAEDTMRAPSGIPPIDPLTGVPILVPDPNYTREKGVNVPAAAVVYLRQNPDSAPKFDAIYGRGMAKKILDKYPVQ